MNETMQDEKTADGEPLVDRGTAESARASVTEPDEDDEELDDDEDEDEDEDEEEDI